MFRDKAMQVVLPKDLLELLKSRKRTSLVEMKILLILLEKIFIQETELQKILRFNHSTLEKIITKLMNSNLIIRVKNENEILIGLQKRFFTLEECCCDCKHLNIEKSESGISVWKCNGQVEIKCLWDYRRLGYNIHKIIGRTYARINSEESYNRKFADKGPSGKTSDWSKKDFISYFLITYKDLFPRLIQPSSTECRYKILECISKFKDNIENWKILCKLYLRDCMEENKGDMFKIMPELSNSMSITRFLNVKGKRLKNVKYCLLKGINCGYYVDGECQLKKSKIECTDKTVEKMKEKFN